MKETKESKMLLMMSNPSYIWFEKRQFEQMFDYEFQTTFWEDFCICEKYWSKENNKGLLEYFNNAFDVAKDNYKMLTELVLVLNWKTWKYAEIQDLSRLYAELQVKTDAYAMENLNGEELDYYIRETQY